jgi:hypothetical protein
MRESSNPLGTASLGLGIAAASLVFGIGVCALVGARQGWLQVLATPLFVCGASSAFLGLLGGVVGVAGLFGNRPKGTAVIGLLLSLGGVCLFLFTLSRLR